jgi:lysophospholipase L1-like esterase
MSVLHGKNLDVISCILKGLIDTPCGSVQVPVSGASVFSFSSPSNWAAMGTTNRTNLETVLSTPFTLSAAITTLGDSLTDGYIDGTEYAVPLTGVINPAQVVNEGISGNTANDVIARMAGWSASELARNTVLWIGTNDITDTAAQVNSEIDTIVGNITGETLVMLPLYSTPMLSGSAGIRKQGIHTHLEGTYGARHMDPQMMYMRTLSETADATELDEIRVGDIPRSMTPQGLDSGDPEYISSDGLHVNRIASGHIYPDIARGFLALDGRGVLLKDGMTFGADPSSAEGTVIGTVPSVGSYDEIGIGDNVGTKFTVDGQGRILQGAGSWDGVEEVYLKARHTGDSLEHMARAVVMESTSDLSAPHIRLGLGFLERWEDVGSSLSTGFTAAVCFRSVDSVRKQILNVGRFALNSNGQSLNLSAKNPSNQTVVAGNVGLPDNTGFHWLIIAYDHATRTVKSRLNGSNASGALFARSEERIDLSGAALFGDNVINSNLIAYKGTKDARCLWFADEYVDPDAHSGSFFNSVDGEPAFIDQSLTVNGVTPLIAKMGGPWNWRSHNRGSAGVGDINPYVVSAANAPFRRATP